MAKNETAGYKHEPEMRMPQRIAHFLDWAAKEHPQVWWPYPLITKAVMGYTRHPSAGSKDVELIRRNMSAARKIMLKTYRRGIVSVHSVGVRGTTDDLDFTKNCVAKTSTQLNNLGQKLSVQASIVDVASFPSTDDGKKWKRFINDTRTVVRQIMDPDFERRLLPPARTEATEQS